MCALVPMRLDHVAAAVVCEEKDGQALTVNKPGRFSQLIPKLAR
jgi:hypothetical protein